jgi:tetratricopeptide (TPR) repeat protein
MEKNENSSGVLNVPFDEKTEWLQVELADILKNSKDTENIQKIATTLHSVAQSYLMKGQLDNAEVCFQKAVEVYRKTIDEHSLVLCLSQHALVLRHQLKRENAEESLIEVVKLSRKLGIKRKDIKNWFLKSYFLNLLEIFNEKTEAILLKKKLEQEW